VDRAIREIIQPVVERSVTIACITSRELILKDFAMEPDENKMRKAAHYMVSNLAGSLALVTCKEPLRVSMSNHIRSLLQAANADQQLKEQVVQVCSAENLELGCMLIEKAATEKAMRDIDEGLAASFAARRKHREQTGQPFYDMSIFTPGNRYPQALPEPLRPKPGGLQAQHLLVYEAFQKSWQMSMPPNRPGMPGGGVGQGAPGLGVPGQSAGGGSDNSAGGAGDSSGTASLTTPQALEKHDAMMAKLEQGLATLRNQAGGREFKLAEVPADHDVRNLMREVRAIDRATQPQFRDEVVSTFAQKIFKRMYEQGAQLDRLALDVMIAVLNELMEVGKKLKAELTSWVTFVPYDNNPKLHCEVLCGLLRCKSIVMSNLDEYLRRIMDGGRSGNAIEFTINLLRHTIVTDNASSVAEFPVAMDALTSLVQRHGSTGKYASVAQMLDEIRSASAAAKVDGKKGGGKMGEGGVGVGRQQDPAGLRERVTYLLEHWIRIWNESPGSEKAYVAYLNHLQQQGVLKTQENSERFFRITTELCIENCFNTAAAAASNDPDNGNGASGSPKLSYTVVDAFSKLIVLLVKYADPVTPAMSAKFSDPVQANTAAKIGLLTRVLATISSVLVNDYEERKAVGKRFDQRAYFRLFVNLLQDLNAPDPVLDASNFQVLTAFADCFHMLQPMAIPGFAFAWLELISHRMFMPNLLIAKQHKGWPALQRLLVDLFRFLEPHLRTADLNEAARQLYKGALRVLLVLLHDFPEFLCDYHFAFCDVISPSCIQLRNLILSAFPRNMRLPDPFTPNLKVDLLPEITQPPRLLSNHAAALSHNNLRAEVDQCLSAAPRPEKQAGADKQAATAVSSVSIAQLKEKLLFGNAADAAAAGTKYNVPAMNALVLYVGTQAIAQLQSNKAGVNITHSAPMDIFQQMSTDLDAEGRYFFLNAIANQLRYPNNHTHYFSCVLLYLFAEAGSEYTQEQITRVLLERLIVHRPHPWGLLITFIELIKNPRYNFWNHGFT
jgi:CCR4-NOT transcription complex subunit 1